MAINRGKYRQAILYLLQECDNGEMGKTKLMKLLYYLDFEHFRRYRTSVTGDFYEALDQGPVPEHANQMLESMVNDGLLTLERIPFGEDRIQHRYRPTVAPDLSALDDGDLKVLASVIARWKSSSTRAIVDFAHLEYPWKHTPRYERIPYRLAFSIDRPARPTGQDRDDIIRSVMSSQSLEGIDLTYDEAAAIFDQVLSEPPIRVHC